MNKHEKMSHLTWDDQWSRVTEHSPVTSSDCGVTCCPSGLHCVLGMIISAARTQEQSKRQIDAVFEHDDCREKFSLLPFSFVFLIFRVRAVCKDNQNIYSYHIKRFVGYLFRLLTLRSRLVAGGLPVRIQVWTGHGLMCPLSKAPDSHCRPLFCMVCPLVCLEGLNSKNCPLWCVCTNFPTVGLIRGS